MPVVIYEGTTEVGLQGRHACASVCVRVEEDAADTLRTACVEGVNVLSSSQSLWLIDEARRGRGEEKEDGGVTGGGVTGEVTW